MCLICHDYTILLSCRDGRVMGVLEVSRSIGDGPYKNHGVTCTPEIKRCQIGSDDRYDIDEQVAIW